MKQFVKGNTTEAKFKSIQRTLEHFYNRLHHTIIGAMPPVPISHFAELPEEDGTIWRYIFPLGGMLKVGVVYIEELLDDVPVEFTAKVNSIHGGAFHSFVTKRHSEVMVPMLPVATGDRLVFSTAEPDKVKGIWVGLLLEVKLSDMNKEHFVIDQFEKLLEGGMEDAS